jgi:hypothetical protein
MKFTAFFISKLIWRYYKQVLHRGIILINSRKVVPGIKIKARTAYKIFEISKSQASGIYSFP